MSWVKRSEPCTCLQVAQALDRVPSWPKNRLSKDLAKLVEETKAAQRQLFGGGNRMPSAEQLSSVGRSDLRQAIIRVGDPLSAPLIAAMLRLKYCYWL